VHAVTLTQKRIEAAVSGEMWIGQWRLGQQKDAYVAFIRVLGIYVDAYNTFTDIGLSLPTDPLKLEIAKQALNKAITEFVEAETLVELFCGQHVAAALTEIDSVIASSQVAYSRLLEGEQAEDESEILNASNLLTIMVEAARLDLGMPRLGREIIRIGR